MLSRDSVHDPLCTVLLFSFFEIDDRSCIAILVSRHFSKISLPSKLLYICLPFRSFYYATVELLFNVLHIILLQTSIILPVKYFNEVLSSDID